MGRNVFAQRMLLRKHHAWCSACYGEAGDSDVPIYDRLLWALAVVNVCPIHAVRLATKCPTCERERLPLLAPDSKPGFCPRCRAWLGAAVAYARNDAIVTPELLWEIRVAAMVGELLASAPTLPIAPDRDTVRKSLAVARELLPEKTVAALGRVIELPKEMLSDLLCGRKQRFQIQTLLYISLRVGVPLLSFINGTAEFIESFPRSRLPITDSLRPGPNERRFSRAAIVAGMTAASSEPEPPSLPEIASRFGCNVSYLCNYYPELASSITARRKSHVKARRNARIDGLREEVIAICRELHSAGVRPTHDGVRARLSYRAGFMYPEVFTAFREVVDRMDARRFPTRDDP